MQTVPSTQSVAMTFRVLLLDGTIREDLRVYKTKLLSKLDPELLSDGRIGYSFIDDKDITVVYKKNEDLWYQQRTGRAV